MQAEYATRFFMMQVNYLDMLVFFCDNTSQPPPHVYTLVFVRMPTDYLYMLVFFF